MNSIMKRFLIALAIVGLSLAMTLAAFAGSEASAEPEPAADKDIKKYTKQGGGGCARGGCRLFK